jgi:hypothetical protein
MPDEPVIKGSLSCLDAGNGFALLSLRLTFPWSGGSKVRPTRDSRRIVRRSTPRYARLGLRKGPVWVGDGAASLMPVAPSPTNTDPFLDPRRANTTPKGP